MTRLEIVNAQQTYIVDRKYLSRVVSVIGFKIVLVAVSSWHFLDSDCLTRFETAWQEFRLTMPRFVADKVRDWQTQSGGTFSKQSEKSRCFEICELREIQMVIDVEQRSL